MRNYALIWSIATRLFRSVRGERKIELFLPLWHVRFLLTQVCWQTNCLTCPSCCRSEDPDLQCLRTEWVWPRQSCVSGVQSTECEQTGSRDRRPYSCSWWPSAIHKQGDEENHTQFVHSVVIQCRSLTNLSSAELLKYMCLKSSVALLSLGLISSSSSSPSKKTTWVAKDKFTWSSPLEGGSRLQAKRLFNHGCFLWKPASL